MGDRCPSTATPLRCASFVRDIQALEGVRTAEISDISRADLTAIRRRT